MDKFQQATAFRQWLVDIARRVSQATSEEVLLRELDEYLVSPLFLGQEGARSTRYPPLPGDIPHDANFPSS